MLIYREQKGNINERLLKIRVRKKQDINLTTFQRPLTVIRIPILNTLPIPPIRLDTHARHAICRLFDRSCLLITMLIMVSIDAVHGIPPGAPINANIITHGLKLEAFAMNIGTLAALSRYRSQYYTLKDVS